MFLLGQADDADARAAVDAHGYREPKMPWNRPLDRNPRSGGIAS